MFSLIFAGIAPGLALLVFFYLRDTYRLEPLKHVLKMFVVGVILVFPTMAFEYALRQGFGTVDVFDSYVTIAFTEEFLKLFFLYHLAYKHPVFDEPYDGIVYAVAIALGFASMENVFYLIVSGIEIAWIRALIPVPGHALFGVLMGYYIGRARFSEKSERPKWFALTVLTPVLAHGSLDFILFNTHVFWKWAIVPFMLFLWAICLRRVKVANNRSPYAKESAAPMK